MLVSTTAGQSTRKLVELHTQFQRSRVFSSLTDAQIDELIRHTSIRRLPGKFSLNMRSQDSPVVYYLISGRAKVAYSTHDGKQPILYFVAPDELIGEQSIFHGSLPQDHVETMETSLVASIPTRNLRRLVLHEPAFATELLELTCRRRILIERRIRHTMFLSNRDRLTHVLLDLAEQFGQGSHDNYDLTVKLSHQDLANFIGSTRETVTVVLQGEGLLSIRRRRIVLRDVHALAKSVHRMWK